MEYNAENQEIIYNLMLKQEAATLLTKWYKEGGYTSLNKLRLAAQKAGYIMPMLTFDDFTGQVIIKKYATTIYLADIQDTVTTIKPLRDLVSSGFYSLGITADGDYRIYAAPGSELTRIYPDYDGYEYSLYDWINKGKVCDCGNHFISPDGKTDCPVCRDRHSVREYSVRAEDILGSEETNERLFGIELEYEKVTGKHVGTHLAGHAIAKKDATIRSGVEVVTRPACVKTHKKALLAFFDAVTTTAASNTGMHIHVSKKGIGQIQLGMLLLFMNRAENVPFITKVAGRDIETNTYCKPISGASITYNVDSDSEVFRSVTRTSTIKYAPLNTAKPQTIEFRIFRSPESHLEMSAKLDFVKALVEYASPYAVTCAKTLKEKANVPVFLDFVTRNKKDYPDFVKFFSGTF